MAQVIWTGPALDNLNDIAEYIELSNPIAAQDLVQNIFEKVERLEDQPLSGRKPPEIEEFEYREVIANPCRIFYKVDAEKAYILFVLRQEQDLKKYLLSKS
ncbi:MAG: type II toxin-antitoxin system RelE/ParE family toxin [Neptuniibacter sp.]